MSKQLSLGFTDTPIAGVTSLKLDRGLVNYRADFRAKANTPREAILTNITSPVDRPEKFRIAYQDVSDIYKDTGIDMSVRAPSKRGVSLLVQLTEVASVTDTTDPSYRVDLPLSMHLVIKVPANENITAELVESMLGRLTSGVFETGSSDDSRLKSLLRGSLLPTDM